MFVMTSREALRAREVIGDDQLCKWLGMKPTVLTVACLCWDPSITPWMKVMDAYLQG